MHKLLEHHLSSDFRILFHFKDIYLKI